MSPCKKRPTGEITWVVLMGICFALEGDQQVGAKQAASAERLSRLNQAKQPFEEVEQKEWEVEKFTLLTCVDKFVAEVG